MAKRSSEQSLRVPVEMRETFQAVVELTDVCCKECLNDEYAELCRKLAAALCRKRPSPLVRGGLNVWAAAIVYTIGGENFLFDPSQSPHMTGAQIADAFGVAKSTIANKAKQIRDMLKISRFDAQWCLPSRLADNPLVWMIQVDGFLVDARRMPLPIQQEAFRRGLIPHIPLPPDVELAGAEPKQQPTPPIE